MEKIKVFIADSEMKYVDLIQAMFSKSDKFEILGTSQDGLETYNKILELKPELVFVGEKLNNLNGQDIMEKINPFILDAKTFFVLLSDTKKALQHDFLYKYNNIEILYKPIENIEIKQIRDNFFDYKEEFEQKLNNKAFVKRAKLDKSYDYVRRINYSKYLQKDDEKILHNLGIDIDFNRLYTEREHDLVQLELVAFWDGGHDIYDNLLPPDRNLEYTGVSREDFNRIYDTILSIKTLYT